MNGADKDRDLDPGVTAITFGCPRGTPESQPDRLLFSFESSDYDEIMQTVSRELCARGIRPLPARRPWWRRIDRRVAVAVIAAMLVLAALWMVR